jgi:outer membrane protein assembly factor BamB
MNHLTFRARVSWTLFLLGSALAWCAPSSHGGEGLIASPEPDWPQWRGPRRDGISGERGLLSSWPEDGPKLLWKASDVGRGWAAPIVVDDTIYLTGDVGDDLVLFAFDRGGRKKWQVTNGRAWKGSYPGARACCAYSEGRLYHINAHGRLVCLQADTGREVWSVEVLARFEAENIQWAISECLLVDGPHVIVTPVGKQALMAALDKRDGRTVWTTEALQEDRPTYSSPILFRHAGRRLLANCSSAHGFGVDADTGKLQWTFPMRNRYDVTVTTPVYGAGGVFYATPDGPNGNLYRLRAEADAVRVEHAWNTPMDTLTGGAVFVDGRLYGSGYRRLKYWMIVDWQSGQMQQELKDLFSGAALYADDRLYCLLEDGRCALLKLTPGGCDIASQFRLVPGKVRDAWAHPVLLDGRLYLRYHETLWCFDVRGS